MTRNEILKKAGECVCQSREDEYGPPENNFACIAGMWNVYLQRKLGISCNLVGSDVAAMCCMLKLSRIAGGNAKIDSWIDIAGYAACGGEIENQAVVTKKQQKEL